MEPSLCDGDLLLVRRPRAAPRRGSVIVIDAPRDNGPRWQVKRVVGLPGERVTFDDGLLFVNDAPHTEPYLGGLPAYLGLDRTTFDIGDDRYFVLGDNRAHSTDSRSFGPISANRIVGIFVARLWPPFRRS